MPLAMAFRDNPQARCTRDTPPYGNTNASLAAIRRRVRSSNIGQTEANFCRSRASGFTLDHHIDSQLMLITLFINVALAPDRGSTHPLDGCDP